MTPEAIPLSEAGKTFIWILSIIHIVMVIMLVLLNIMMYRLARRLKAKLANEVFIATTICLVAILVPYHLIKTLLILVLVGIQWHYVKKKLAESERKASRPEHVTDKDEEETEDPVI